MLNNSSVGTNLAEIITNENIKLVPKQNTLLQEIVSAIANNIYDKLEKRDYIEPTILRAASGNEIVNKNIKTYSESTHDSLMDNYINDITNLVSNHISFARNVVNKEVTKLKETLEENLSNFKYKEAEDFFKISYYSLPDVFRSFIIENELSSYKNSTNNFFSDQLDLSKINFEEFDLEKYILTGDEEQDTLILAWFNSVGKELAINYLVNNIPEYSLSVNRLLDYSFINYLFYRNLTEKNDINLGLTSIQLRSKSSANRDYFGKKIVISLDLYEKDIRNNSLLTSDSETAFSYFNKEALHITIYEESFKKLADAGLSIEVLFGFISSENKNNVTVDTLIQNKDKYLSNWNNIRNLYVISMNNNRLDIFKQILHGVFESSLSELTDAEKELSNNSSELIIETKTLGNDYIDKLTLSDIEHINFIVLNLVAKIRFRFSNAYFILHEMHELLDLNENIQPLEAALYASINYITDFLVEQLDVVKM